MLKRMAATALCCGVALPLFGPLVERMLNLIETRGFSNPKNARNFALLNVAIHDATVAAWDPKYVYQRPRPAVADPSIPTAVPTPDSPSYPSEQSLEGVFRVFYVELSRRVLEYLKDDPSAAARAYALAAIAHNHGAVACWDAKYTYWAARPNQLDTSIVTLFPQTGHPSYPAAHGCFSGAIARVIGGLFPDFADAMEARAAEAAESRMWSGIHYRSDIEAGLAIGRRIGDIILQRAAAGPLQR
jgi:membrane-associated phospholipid phosphatase